MFVDVANIQQALIKIEELNRDDSSAYVCVSNVHMCMEAYDSSEYASIINNANLVLADGRPIYWAQKLLGYKQANQVRGQDIMHALCKVSGEKRLNIGLYGGADSGILNIVETRLSKTFPDIRIVFSYAPPFRKKTQTEEQKIIDKINDSSVDVLFVGLGCPKQEGWMAEHKDKLNCVMLGVGAAFDFIAGTKAHAPRVIQKLGLEWLFRLISEPRRLWKRYLFNNPRFVYLFIKQYIKQQFF